MRTIVAIVALFLTTTACTLDVDVEAFTDLGPFPASFDLTWEYVGTCENPRPLDGAMPNPARYRTLDASGGFRFIQPGPVGGNWSWEDVVIDQNKGTVAVPPQYVLEFDNTDCPDTNPLITTEQHVGTIGVNADDLWVISGVVKQARPALCGFQADACTVAYRYTAVEHVEPPAEACGELSQDCCRSSEPFTIAYTCNDESLRCAAVTYPVGVEGPARVCVAKD